MPQAPPQSFSEWAGIAGIPSGGLLAPGPCEAAAGALFDGKLQNDGMMVGRTAFQNLRRAAAQILCQTAVKPQRNDVAGIVGGFARSDVLEAGNGGWADRVEIADNGGWPLQSPDQVQKLQAVENLSVRQMHIGEIDAPEMYQLRDAGRHASGKGRNRQAQGRRPRQKVRAPQRQTIDALLHGSTIKMSADLLRQLFHLLGCFLEQQKIGLMVPDQGRDIFAAGADPAQQVPAQDPQPRGGMPEWNRIQVAGELIHQPILVRVA